jgi:formiminotetrahydrofolate cyclodeaminase
MITGLTIGRERYAGVREEMTAMAHRAEVLRSALSEGMDADTDAYGAVIAAYRLPKETAAEKAARETQIQTALRRAAEVPLSVAEVCLETLMLTSRAAALGNRNAVSDAAVGALMAHAGLQGAVRNVRVNLRSIEDAAFCTATEARVTGLVAACERALVEALAAADARR